MVALSGDTTTFSLEATNPNIEEKWTKTPSASKSEQDKKHNNIIT